jgi:hypothetical protein
MSRSDRVMACKLAAQVLVSRPDVQTIPFAWSLAVFFEQYISGGADFTRKAFGPKKAVKLKIKSGGKL